MSDSEGNLLEGEYNFSETAGDYLISFIFEFDWIADREFCNSYSAKLKNTHGMTCQLFLN